MNLRNCLDLPKKKPKLFTIVFRRLKINFQKIDLKKCLWTSIKATKKDVPETATATENAITMELANVMLTIVDQLVIPIVQINVLDMECVH